MELSTEEHLKAENIMHYMLKLKSKAIWTEDEKTIAAIHKKIRQEDVSRKKDRERNTNVNMCAR